MKKMTIAAVALVVALSARATGFDGLTLQTNDWFDVSMAGESAGTSINVNDTTGITRGAGSWTVVPSDGTATTAIEGGVHYIALSAQDESLTFTPAPFAVTSGYETVVAKIKADAGDELPEIDASAQAAFTVIVSNGTLQAYGLTSAGWTSLNYALVEDLTNNWFTIYMDFANENATRKVRYSVQPDEGALAVLSHDTETWFETVNQPTITDISFSGFGKVQQFSGDELTEPITFGTVKVEFLADYQTATTVVANVSGTVAANTTFTLSVLENNYTGAYDNGSVTFYNVTLTNEFALGSTVGYQLSAGGTYTETAPVPQSTTVGNPTGGWIYENSTHNGSSGAWTNSANERVNLVYENNVAELSDHLFTPTNAVGDAIVTVESQVCFGDVADLDSNPTDDSYAAIRLAEVNSTPTFQIWAKETKEVQASWISVFNGNAVVDPMSTTTVQSNFDFVDGTCSFYVGGVALTNASGASGFYLANGVRKMSAIKFNGVGTLTQLSGSYVAAGYTEEVGTGTNVTVSSKWVASNLSDKTVAEARELMSPTNRTDAALTQHGGTKFNYFECYALGIDPADQDEAPEISEPTVGDDGKFSFKLDGVDAPDGVTLTVTMKSYDSPDGDPDDSAVGVEGTMTIVGGGKTTNNLKVDPSEVDQVKYYKFDISIGATP